MKKKTVDLKKILLKKIKEKGGFVNCHGHFDRAFTINLKNLSLSHELMEKKWTLVDEMKRSSTEEDFAIRIEKALQKMISQGAKICASCIDVDDLVKLRAIKAAQKIKKKYKKKIKFIIVSQTLKGLIDKKERKWLEKSLPFVDIIGGLPSKDRPQSKKHLDILFKYAKETGKNVHVHIDQENSPHEHDTEVLAKKVIEYGLEGKVIAIHALSVAAQPLKERKRIYKLMKRAGLSVIYCPAAGLSMKQLCYKSYLHNSTAPVPELLKEGITVSLGCDNIADIYQPFIDGDLWTELRILMEANRFYKINALTKIASVNGRKVLGVSNAA